ncbi:hypothetical protein niasHT_029852 [Heterodera trifolii]|uniref:Uncharacterized protein n=1 Tax=Heterodera trifolii TaxID=157864 RepID=A0ABD2K7C3_9BILA
MLEPEAKDEANDRGRSVLPSTSPSFSLPNVGHGIKGMDGPPIRSLPALLSLPLFLSLLPSAEQLLPSPEGNEWALNERQME